MTIGRCRGCVNIGVSTVYAYERYVTRRSGVENARARDVGSARAGERIESKRTNERTNERTNDDGDDAIGTDRGGMEETNRDFVVGIFVVGIFVVAKKNAKNGGFSGGD